MEKIEIKDRLEEIKEESNNGFFGFVDSGRDYIMVPNEDNPFEKLMFRCAEVLEEVTGVKQDPKLSEDEFGGIWFSTLTGPDEVGTLGKTIDECFGIVIETCLGMGESVAEIPDEVKGPSQEEQFKKFYDYVFVDNRDKLIETIKTKLKE